MTEGNAKKLKMLVPDVIVGLLSTHIGEAWRMSGNGESYEKVLNFCNNLPVAFGHGLASFYPTDMLVGLVAALLLRLVVYEKEQNAKKYRQGSEYGSARWGTQEDIVPFEDPVFQNNIILTASQR